MPNGPAPNALNPGEDGNGFVGALAKGLHWELPHLGLNEQFSTHDWVRIPLRNCAVTMPRSRNNAPVLDDTTPPGLHTFQWRAPLTLEKRDRGRCHNRDYVDGRDDNGVRASLDLIISYNLASGTDARIALGVALRNNGPEPVTLSQFGLIGGLVNGKLTTTVPWKNYRYNFFTGLVSPDEGGHSFPDNTWVFHPQPAATDIAHILPAYNNGVGAWSDPTANPAGKMRIFYWSAGSPDEADTAWTQQHEHQVYMMEAGQFQGSRTLPPGQTAATVWHVIQTE